MEKWTFEHSNGWFEVQSLGGMAGPIVFELEGREVSPMFVAPWHNESAIMQEEPLFHSLRGEWPCVQFGGVQKVVNLHSDWQLGQGVESEGGFHGYSANHHWKLLHQSAEEISIFIDYPDDHSIKRLTRTIRPSKSTAALEFELTVQTRADCRLPIGIHPTLKLPELSGSMELLPTPFRQGITFPGDYIAEGIHLKPNSTFASLKKVMSKDNMIDLTHLPLAQPIECLVQLCGTEGYFEVAYSSEQYRLRLDWNPVHFPSCLIWISDRALTSYPWHSRTRIIGIEPVNSAFDLGRQVSMLNNPISEQGISTCMNFYAGQRWTTNYNMSVCPTG